MVYETQGITDQDYDVYTLFPSPVKYKLNQTLYDELTPQLNSGDEFIAINRAKDYILTECSNFLVQMGYDLTSSHPYIEEYVIKELSEDESFVINNSSNGYLNAIFMIASDEINNLKLLDTRILKNSWNLEEKDNEMITDVTSEVSFYVKEAGLILIPSYMNYITFNGKDKNTKYIKLVINVKNS